MTTQLEATIMVLEHIMRQHPDPTKTPVELWKDAKRAEKDGESEHE